MWSRSPRYTSAHRLRGLDWQSVHALPQLNRLRELNIRGSFSTAFSDRGANALLNEGAFGCQHRAVINVTCYDLTVLTKVGNNAMNVYSLSYCIRGLDPYCSIVISLGVESFLCIPSFLT